MKYITFVAALLCLTGCCASRSTPTAEVTSAPKKDVYTDAEAKVFIGRLPDVKYPTTIRAACSQLGIERARIQTHFIRTSDGGIESSTTQLSKSYSIGFHKRRNEETLETYQVHKITIWKFRNREK